MVAVRDKKTSKILYHEPPYTEAEEFAFYASVNAPPLRFFSRALAAPAPAAIPAPEPPPAEKSPRPSPPPAAARPSRGRRR